MNTLTTAKAPRMTPLNQRRLATFINNKRAKWSLAIFLVLFTASLFSEFIANDKPLLVVFEGGVYVPVIKGYPETTFNGDFDTEADYADPYVSELIKDKGFIIWPLVRYSYNTHVSDLKTPAPSPPSLKNWLGTDDQARDVFARVIYGFRV